MTMQLYFHPSPNPMKAALMLEELGSPYETIAVDTFKGAQHEPAFRRLNPNAKVPVLVDDARSVFDSNAILLYLAARTGRFLGANEYRADVYSWLMFVATGLSPFSGQAIHFMHHAPETLPYAQNRYVKEITRHYSVLDERLSQTRYLAGEEYSIADIAAWGWMIYAPYIFGETGLSPFANVTRLLDKINARPAAQRALALRERVKVKAEFDDETRRSLFPQNY